MSMNLADQSNFLNTIDSAAESTPKHHKNEQIMWGNIGLTCLYLLTFLAPLFFLPFTISPIDLNKNVLVIMLTSIALISWIAKAFVMGEVAYRKSIINLAVLSIVVVTGISALFSVSRYESFGNLYALQDGFFNIALYGLVFWLYFHMLQNGKTAFRILFLCVQSLFLVGVASLLQINKIFLFPLSAEVFHTLGANDFSTYMPVAIMMAVGIIILTVFCMTERLTSFIKSLCVLFGVTMFMNLFLINSPVVWIGLVLSMIIILSYQIFRGNMTGINDIVLPMIILILSIMLFIVGPSGLLKKDLQKELVLGTANVTWDITKQALAGYKNFFLGSGPATFRHDHSQYRDVGLNNGDLWGIRFNNGYSSFLTYLTTVGLLGIAAWLFLIGSCLIVFARGLSSLAQRDEADKNWHNKECLLLSASVSAIFLFFVWFFYPLNMIATLFLFMLIGVFSAAFQPDKHHNVFHIFISSQDNKGATISFMLVISLVFALGLLLSTIYITAKKYVGAVYAAKGIKAFNTSQDGALAITYLTKAIVLDSGQDRYYKSLAEVQNIEANKTFNEITKANAENKTDNKAQEVSLQKLESVFKASVANAQQAQQINPTDPSHWLSLGMILENRASVFADMDDAANYAYKQYIKLEPKNPDGYLSMGRLNMVIADRYRDLIRNPQIAKQKDSAKIVSNLEKLKADYLTKALDSINESLKLKPNYAIARYLIAQIYDRQNKLTEAIKELSISAAIYRNDPKLAFQLAVMHYRNKDYDNAKSEFLRTLSLDENYSDARFYLGFVYDKLGDKESAKKEFEAVAKLNSNDTKVGDTVKVILENIKNNKSATTGLNVE